MEPEEIIKKAIDAVNLFDQANTGSAIENLGSRGAILKGAIDELREALNRTKKQTILTSDQARHQ